MKKIFGLIILISITSSAQINFDQYFETKTLRLDYFHTGNFQNDSYSIDELIEEPYWGGSKINLLDKFSYGKYRFIVKDEKSGNEIYSRGYSTLFGEWQTTDEAKQTIKSFSETITFPYPKNPVIVEFYSRDKKNVLHKKFDYKINPSDYFIKKERKESLQSFKVLYNGDPSEKVDIVFIPDGYTNEEMEKFGKDCERFREYIFKISPYNLEKDKFNIWGIIAPSKESGTDIPKENIWKNTAANSSFYTFNLERYLMISDNKNLRDIASNAPYDQIYVLVNSAKYGGGAIFNHYSVCTSDNPSSEFVFTHEFGHGFVSLGDEYYTSDVAYSEFYPKDVEPLEANLTTLIDFDSKWIDLIEPGTPIPTPAISSYKHKVGVYEGGGYEAKGVYRPMQDCSMNSISIDNFCPVCKKTILQMIDFYSE